MEQLQNGVSLELCQGAFPLSTDSMALGWFARLPKNARVLDIGSGCGTLGLLLCAGNENCHVTGVELMEDAHAMALENIRRNHLDSRMNSICADLRTIPQSIPGGSFSVCVSNPPYFSAGAVSLRTPQARHQLACSMEDLMKSAAWALKYGGDLYLCQKPQSLAELIVTAKSFDLELKRLALLRHSPGTPVSLALMHFRKGGRPGLTLEEIVLYDGEGRPTAQYREIYHTICY